MGFYHRLRWKAIKNFRRRIPWSALGGLDYKLGRLKSKAKVIICQKADAILLGLIGCDKNGVEDITLTLSGGTIDNLSIDNKGT